MWISVEERLPDTIWSLLVAYQYGVAEAKYFAGNFYLPWQLPTMESRGTIIPGVTHWQPLPAPPGAEDEVIEKQRCYFCEDLAHSVGQGFDVNRCKACLRNKGQCPAGADDERLARVGDE